MKIPIGGGRLTMKARNQYLEEDNARLRRDVKKLASRLFDANERIRDMDNEIGSLKAILSIERQIRAKEPEIVEAMLKAFPP